MEAIEPPPRDFPNIITPIDTFEIDQRGTIRGDLKYGGTYTITDKGTAMWGNNGEVHDGTGRIIYTPTGLWVSLIENTPAFDLVNIYMEP